MEEVRRLTEKEKVLAENIASICQLLPDNKKEFLLGYAEGVIAMSEMRKGEQQGDVKETVCVH